MEPSFNIFQGFLVPVVISHGADEFGCILLLHLELVNVVLDWSFEEVLERDHLFLGDFD